MSLLPITHELYLGLLAQYVTSYSRLLMFILADIITIKKHISQPLVMDFWKIRLSMNETDYIINYSSLFSKCFRLRIWMIKITQQCSASGQI